jgi:hypothetical protein
MEYTCTVDIRLKQVLETLLRPATHYPVDLTTGTPDSVCVCVLIRVVELTDRPFQPYLSGLPDSVCVR